MTTQLGELETQAEAARDAILAKRNEVLAVKNRIVGQRDELAEARVGRAAILARVRSSRKNAQEDLAALEREQSRITARLRVCAPRTGAVAAVARPSRPARFGAAQAVSSTRSTVRSPPRSASAGDDFTRASTSAPPTGPRFARPLAAG